MGYIRHAIVILEDEDHRRFPMQQIAMAEVVVKIVGDEFIVLKHRWLCIETPSTLPISRLSEILTTRNTWIA